MSDERLGRAIGSVQSRKMEEARSLLEQILKEDRANIPAWHWYAQTWSNPREKVRVWEACLRFNPANKQAQDALRDLQPSTKITGTNIPAKEEKTQKQSSQVVMWGGLVVIVAAAVLGILLILNSLPKDPSKYLHKQPVEYYLYVPRNYSADREWPLFVGIHGAGGSGLECWNLWQSYAEKEGFILLCPSIPGDASGFEQNVGENTVWSAIGEVKKEYHIRSRMFLTGFSAGAFFIQGFDYHYPQYVSGLSILSSGVYLNPNMFAEVIPMVVLIGDADNQTAVQTSQMFVNDLKQYGFDVRYEVLSGVGHTVTNKGRDMTIELFRETIR